MDVSEMLVLIQVLKSKIEDLEAYIADLEAELEEGCNEVGNV